ncbi:MAG TPA: bifunctional phosphoribosylaminoimidazolecarboxamide formyltransferase/IMP cyclohydrolase [Candidatus Cloacimonadota bacterium]|nr:bifunctional phosphoribosylaminoimidazolecarboxamide formyltransferase/IMP cyclohydrolase [Candidatus Cloacimonadota bacterium]
MYGVVMKRALLSLSDKRNLEEFANDLLTLGYELVSTGGTLKVLQDANINAKAVSEVTSFPEIMNGRVKTLHPKIMGGILAVPRNLNHIQQAKENGIELFDLIVVNLYPFEKTINNPLATWADKIENIDIGGPSLIRAAAKNYQFVTVVTDPSDYDKVIEELKNNQETTIDTRRYLAQKAFAHTAAYDSLIADTFNHEQKDRNKGMLNIGLPLKDDLRYGENPHQKAGFYESDYDHLIEVIHGKQLSYNNYLDIDSGLKLIMNFDKKTVAILKHTNPCGVASADTLLEAYRNAFACDTLSPFGGIVILNDELDMETAKAINEVFTEIIIAPAVNPETLNFLKKKKDRRIVIYQQDELIKLKTHKNVVTCLNGYLCQESDNLNINREDWTFASQIIPDDETMYSLEFAWKVVAKVKSNAICLVKGTQTIGIGVGQTSRVDSLKIAINRAEEMGFDLTGAICASDGFFPKTDSIDLMVQKGVKAIIQPGGSKADPEVIDAVNNAEIAMILTNRRHFRH